MNSELFPELLVLDDLSNGSDRGLRALVPPFVRWLPQTGTVIDPDVFIPGKPSGQGPLEVSSKRPVV